MNKLAFADKLNRSRALVALVCLGIFLVLLYCNINTTLVADDFRYCFSFADDSRIDSVGDIFPSMAAHRHSMNGRVVAHFMVQLFLMLPKMVFNIANALMYLAMCLLIYTMAKREQEHNALLLMCIHGLIWVLQPQFGQVYLWLDGSVNYLWCSVLCLIFLIPWANKFLHDREPGKTGQVVYIIFSLLVGAYSENASVAIIFMGMLFILLCRFWRGYKITPWMYISLILAFIGFIYMMLAPAESVNKSAQFSIAVLLSNFVDTFKVYMKFSPLLISYVLFYYLAVKENVDQGRRVLSAVFLLGSMAGHFVLTFALYCAGRSTFIALHLLICANALLFVPLFKTRRVSLLTALCAVCLLFTAFWTYKGVRDIQRSHYLLCFNEELIYEALNVGITDIELPRHYPRTKYSANDGLVYLEPELEDSEAWANVYMAKYYGADSMWAEG